MTLTNQNLNYQVATSEAGNLFVVLVVAGRIARVLRKCEDKADAAHLLRDLSGWRF